MIESVSEMFEAYRSSGLCVDLTAQKIWRILYGWKRAQRDGCIWDVSISVNSSRLEVLSCGEAGEFCKTYGT